MKKTRKGAYSQEISGGCYKNDCAKVILKREGRGLKGNKRNQKWSREKGTINMAVVSVRSRSYGLGKEIWMFILRI